MKIEKFWVVRNPGPNSELGDICFECTPQSYVLFVLGSREVGATDELLDRNNLIFYTDKVEAEQDAHFRLAFR